MTGDSPVVVEQRGHRYIAFEMVVTRVVRLNAGEEAAQAMERYWNTDESGSDFLDEACQDVRFLDREDTIWASTGAKRTLESMRIFCTGDEED